MMANTSTPQTQDAQAQPMKEQWQQLRSEGSTRLQRIGKILQTAFTETKTELQSGTETMRPLAQELSSNVVDNLKETSKTAAEKINNAWTDQPGSPDATKTAKSLLQTLARMIRTHLFPRAKTQAEKLDATLTERYGDRYGAAKHKVKVAKAWYAQATAPVEVPQDEPPVTVDVVVTDSAPLENAGNSQ